MPTVANLCKFLDQFAPPMLAEDWDNVGLLVGRAERDARSVMTCLTVTPAAVAEAVAERADLIVTHHPLPFRALKRMTADEVTGRMLLNLVEAAIAIYSPHTAFDSARQGINQCLAEMLGLVDIQPLTPAVHLDVALGTGRYGRFTSARPLQEVAARLKRSLGLAQVQVVGAPDAPIRSVGIACGSGGELLARARAAECDMFLTGEASFHRCLEAEASEVCLVLLGHYASERFAVERLAEILDAQFPEVRVWASRAERDPLAWL